jgi:2-methylaconitate cis-trans-isomerase PrpF
LANEDDPVSHAVPKVGIVGRPGTYRATDGTLVRPDEYDLAVRMVSMHAPHPAIGLTSAVALAIAAAIPGTLPHAAARQTSDGVLRLGTPAGVITAQTVPGTNGSCPTVLLPRAARRIARAELQVPIAALTAQPSSHERPPSAVPISLTGQLT